jgi:hypothetical protein
MTALAIWCGPHVDPSFINLAYAELTEACNIVKENGSKRSQNVLVSDRHVLGSSVTKS